MWYNDISNVTRYEAAMYVADFFDIKYPVARAVVEACRKAYHNGSKGEGQIHVMASRDLTDLVKDAHNEGIIRKDRVTIRLEDSEGCCINGHSVESSLLECDACGSTAIDHMVSAHFYDEYAEEWADHDQQIEGSSWECDGDNFAYSCFSNRPGLVADLIKEGYNVDASLMTVIEEV